MKILKSFMFFLLFISSGISVNAESIECNSVSCAGLMLPESMREFISGGYSNIEINTLGKSKYIYLSTESDINKCSVIFKVDGKHIDNSPVAGKDGKLCNISEVDGNLVSSRRDQGRWYNDVYKISPREPWVLIFTDSCADCQQVKRTYYKNGIEDYTVLLSEGDSYIDRKPLSGIISIQKAFLYSKPDEQKKTNAYLIKGDFFSLINMSDDGYFYQISYKSPVGKSTSYWIKSDDFDLK